MRSDHSTSAGSRRLTWRWLPMKLSSTRNTTPRQPDWRSASSSVEHLFVLRARDAAVHLDDVQNSQLKGQPREYCSDIAQRLRSASSKSGTGVAIELVALAASIDALGIAALKSRKARACLFGLADEDVIGFGCAPRARGDVRPPTTTRFPCALLARRRHAAMPSARSSRS